MLFGTDCDDTDDIPPQYCTIPVLSCIINVYTTLRLCRLLLASAIDLVNPAFSRFHATSPSNTPCHDMRLHVRELNRRIPLYWMVGTRPNAHCRLRGGLFLPVYEPSALLQAACAMICHLTCVSAASICAGSSGSRHRSNMYALPLLNPRGPAIQARLPRQNVPCLQLIIMLWLWHAYAMSWELVT